MLWLYERKSVSLPRQTKATATASEQTKTFDLQSTGASTPIGLRQTESSGSAFRVNKNQSYRGRLTTRTSRILLTRQLGTVVRQETDNPNQRSTDWVTAKKYAKLARANYPIMTTDEYKSGMSVPNNEWIWGVYDANDQTLYYYSFYAYIASNSNASVCRTYPVAISKELIDQIPETDARRSLYLVPSDAEYAECNEAGRSTGALYARAQADYKDWIYSTSLIYAYMNFKFRDIENPGVGPFPVIRAAEMYYTEAEADCHLNETADAQQLLFDVVSPRDPAYTKSTKTGDDLLTEVKLYRRFDLWGEGNDWFDYKRWGEPIVRKSRAQGGSFLSNFAITINPEDGNAWTWMIPEKETDYNSALRD